MIQKNPQNTELVKPQTAVQNGTNQNDGKKSMQEKKTRFEGNTQFTKTKKGKLENGQK